MSNVKDKESSKDFRAVFRQPLDVNNVHELPSWVKEEGFIYRPVIYTYKHDPERVNHMLDKGWDLVISSADSKDDRPAATKPESAIRDKPIECKYSSGHKAVWMKIPAAKLAEREIQKRNDRIQKWKDSGQISSTDSGYKIIGPEYRVDLENK